MKLRLMNMYCIDLSGDFFFFFFFFFLYIYFSYMHYDLLELLLICSSMFYTISLFCLIFLLF